MEHHLAKVGVAGSIPVSRFFLRRRQAKVPDSCLHEMKALWRPPDIEHEMRDGGGDAGWVVLRLAAYYPLFMWMSHYAAAIFSEHRRSSMVKMPLPDYWVV